MRAASTLIVCGPMIALPEVVMKTGTNRIHGSAVYSNLSRGMMSHDFFTNRFIWDPRTGPITSDRP